MQACSCTCHNGPYYACTVPGGCGHLHRAEPESRRCARQRYCVNREPVRDHHGDLQGFAGVPIDVDRGLCPACARAAQTGIRALPMDYTELHVLLAAATTGNNEEKVTTSRTPPIPINVHHEELQAAIVDRSTFWAAPVAQRLGITWNQRLVRHHTRPGVAVTRASNLLAGAMSTLLYLPANATPVNIDGVGAAIQLLDLHEQVRRAAGRTTLVHHLPAPCPACGRQALRRNNGANYVHCAHCHDRWSEIEYRRLCLVLTCDITAA